MTTSARKPSPSGVLQSAANLAISCLPGAGIPLQIGGTARAVSDEGNADSSAPSFHDSAQNDTAIEPYSVIPSKAEGSVPIVKIFYHTKKVKSSPFCPASF